MSWGIWDFGFQILCFSDRGSGIREPECRRIVQVECRGSNYKLNSHNGGVFSFFMAKQNQITA